jgi:hypothetical protein
VCDEYARRARVFAERPFLVAQASNTLTKRLGRVKMLKHLDLQ